MQVLKQADTSGKIIFFISNMYNLSKR